MIRNLLIKFWDRIWIELNSVKFIEVLLNLRRAYSIFIKNHIQYLYFFLLVHWIGLNKGPLKCNTLMQILCFRLSLFSLPSIHATPQSIIISFFFPIPDFNPNRDNLHAEIPFSFHHFPFTLPRSLTRRRLLRSTFPFYPSNSWIVYFASQSSASNVARMVSNSCKMWCS